MIELLNAGNEVVIVDNLVNASQEAVRRIESITGKTVVFESADLTDVAALDAVFARHKIESVIHFAALKAVGESSKIPLDYYRVNVGGSINLLTAMKKHDVNILVFSSSATVYGDVTRFKDVNMVPIPEHCPQEATNPYGRTKVYTEGIIRDHSKATPALNAGLLRYFNPGGAHPSGLLGEDPLGIPNNLLPYLGQVAVGRRDKLQVFGNDYDSKDGTPIRDYIHVVDLAKAHVSCLEKLRRDHVGCEAWNIGTGQGYTVIDIIDAFSEAVGRKLPYEFVGRRAGDVLILLSDPSKANRELGWKAEFGIKEICKDLWNWQEHNPYGFQEKPQ